MVEETQTYTPPNNTPFPLGGEVIEAHLLVPDAPLWCVHTAGHGGLVMPYDRAVELLSHDALLAASASWYDNGTDYIGWEEDEAQHIVMWDYPPLRDVAAKNGHAPDILRERSIVRRTAPAYYKAWPQPRGKWWY